MGLNQERLPLTWMSEEPRTRFPMFENMRAFSVLRSSVKSLGQDCVFAYPCSLV